MIADGGVLPERTVYPDLGTQLSWLQGLLLH